MAKKDDLERVLDKFEELHNKRSDELKQLNKLIGSLQEETSVLNNEMKNISDKSGEKLERLKDRVDANTRWRHYIIAAVVILNTLILYLLQAAGLIF